MSEVYSPQQSRSAVHALYRTWKVENMWVHSYSKQQGDTECTGMFVLAKGLKIFKFGTSTMTSRKYPNS
jgi:hypothetical protein